MSKEAIRFFKEITGSIRNNISFGLKRIVHPEIFQGRFKKTNYFEGWYYKFVSSDRQNAIAFIPGISLEPEDPHAFIQVIRTVNASDTPLMETAYCRFPLSEFRYEDAPFSIGIGNNHFTKNRIDLQLKTSDFTIKGKVTFDTIAPIRKSVLTPNIMGFFGYFSFMECYHGVLSMGHDCTGVLKVNHALLSFNEGKGYIEKDWGTSFPKKYVWVQCNVFNQSMTSLMLSVAHIPFVGFSFKGFICNVCVDGKEYRFATYNQARLIKEEISHNQVHVRLKRKQLILDVTATIESGAELIAPIHGRMDKAIKEGLSGRVAIMLMTTQGKILYQDTGVCAGVEIVM